MSAATEDSRLIADCDQRRPTPDDRLPHQLLFVTPAMSPSSASFRKHRRHSANFRRYARGRPQRLQRLRSRTLNFGVLSSFAIFAVVAIVFLPYAFRNGMPSSCNSRRDSSSVFAVVTTEMFIPRALS